MSLPAEFIQRLRQIIPPEQWEAVWQALHTPKTHVGLRLNPLQLPETGVPRFFSWCRKHDLNLTPLTGLKGGFCAPITQKSLLSHSEWAQNGQIYLQNPGSQWIGQLLSVEPGMEVLDLAAAPGSKTTQLAAQMANHGYLAAVEPIKSRYFRLKDNLERMGVTHCRTFLADGRSIGRKVPSRFDRVLLDAPCSSEGRIHAQDPASYAHWSVRKIKEQARKQKGLILSAWQALKPGGVLVYATCAFAPEENELIIARLLIKHPEAQLLPIELPFPHWQPGLSAWNGKALPESLTHTRRILPNDLFDGFFVAKIQKPA
ncbi:MAG TPA: RsmB/NOP family class I SAM-dependent RNA methyltransferase [Sulfurivirga caldicuralii]|nr:RsmB/NOP family class I SAM-dependent RNA methyltransferase [Sulfurivirga caldicuralii]